MLLKLRPLYLTIFLLGLIACGESTPSGADETAADKPTIETTATEEQRQASTAIAANTQGPAPAPISEAAKDIFKKTWVGSGCLHGNRESAAGVRED